jgi:phosphoserine phosphatase
MRVKRSIFLLSLACAITFLCAPLLARAADILPTWNDGVSRQAIIDFVTRVTDEKSADFVKTADRIAVFDNDGTLWGEQPSRVQLEFALDRVRALAPQHPEWKNREPYSSILAGDIKGLAASGEKGLVQLITAIHAGMTTEQFADIVTDWFAIARHPQTGRPYYEMTYAPMVELLAYLRANGFKTFVVSGGGVEFIRPMTMKMYGIPPEQVVGSTIATEYALVDTTPVLRRKPEIDFVNDGPGKPVGINKFIGRRPIFAAGNSDGDYEMLRWVTSGKMPSFGMIVHHTDGDREYAYDRNSQFGKLDKALDEAERRKWLVVDMKADWKRIYPTDSN